MDVEEFSERAVEMIDYIADYLTSISERHILPDVVPGYLRPLLPSTAPETGESFEKIMADIEKYIMPGLVHWHHPQFHAYFPSNASFPSILAEMVSDTVGSVNLNWNISVSERELELVVMDWYAKMVGLPDEFLHYSRHSEGGGFVRNTASECIFVCMIAARQRVLRILKQKNRSLQQGMLLASLVAYCSSEAHSCVEKAAMMSMVNVRILDTDEDYRLRGETFLKVVEDDKSHGLVPFFACATIGTTSCSSCDPINEIGPVCEANGMWLHVDAAYGGTFLLCPEYKHLLEGIEHASSFTINPSKMMLVNMDCSVVWTKHYSRVKKILDWDSNLFTHCFKERWCNPFSTRMRALKLWFVIRNYGVEGLQEHVRNNVRLAKIFEKYVMKDKRFEVLASQFGLVCFRLKASNMLNKKLLMSINASGKIHITACMLREKYVIRFCVCSRFAVEKDITYAWSVFCDFATELLEESKHNK